MNISLKQVLEINIINFKHYHYININKLTLLIYNIQK